MKHRKLAALFRKNEGKSFPCETESIPKAVKYVREILMERKIERPLITKAMLKLEDTVNGLIIKAAGPDEEFTVQISGRTGRKLLIIVKCAGEQLNMEDILQVFEYDSYGSEIGTVMREKLLPIYSKGISLKYKYGVNTAVINVLERRISRLAVNFILMFTAVLLGIAVRLLLPAGIEDILANGIFGIVVTIFFNLLKMIVAPLVFVSIISSIIGFGDLKELGRISGRTIGLFVFFSVIALIVGTLVFTVCPAGDSSLINMVETGPDAGTAASVSALESLKNMLIGIFPSNMLAPFVNNDVLAVIFLAVIFGICISRMQSDHQEKMVNAIDIFSDLIYRVTGAIIRLMPVMIFCSMAKLALTINVKQMESYAVFLADMAAGSLIMMMVFAAALKLQGNSPAEFFKGYAPALATAFTTASSSATMTVSLKCCKENLKVPDIITYFVIPLGSTINMNGSCIVLTINVLFLARSYGVALTPSVLIPAMIMILLFSMAAPGVPGSLTIMLAAVLPLLDIPGEAANLTIGFAAIMGMLLVPVNSTGDATVALMNKKAEEKLRKQ